MSSSDPKRLKREVILRKKKRHAKAKMVDRQIRPGTALYYARHYHLNTRGQRMNFKNLHYLWQLYRGIQDQPYLAVIKCVQVGLSELFIIQSHIEAGEQGLTVMYVLPKYELRNRFVNNRIYKLHKKVEYYAQKVREAESNVHRTSLMHYGKGTLVYVGSNVEDEFIEIPVDSGYVDEKDRCNQGNLLMLPDRLTASPYGYQREISNPTVEGYGIDERYETSTKGSWMIKDPNVKYPRDPWFEPDFFRHVVREVGHKQYRVRDPEGDPHEGEVRLIGPSGYPVDRLKKGEWVEEYPGRKWVGRRVSQVYSGLKPLSDLALGWYDAVGNERKEQLFFNSRLGRAFTARGAKITEGVLNQCQVDYTWPVQQVRPSNPRFMGVDVGDVLHVVIRERYTLDGQPALRLIHVGTCQSFSQVSSLIREWKPRRVVFDAYPEIHKVMEIKDEFDQVYSSRFQDGLTKMQVVKQNREIRMDRTAILDYVKEGVDNQFLLLPRGAEELDNGSYYSHMTASTRVLLANEENPEKSRYVWVHTTPDHYFLAEAYCFQASMLMSNSDVFEFFTEQASAMETYRAKEEIPGDYSTEEKVHISNKQYQSPEQFLGNVQKAHGEEEKPKPDVDDHKIRNAIDHMTEAQGYVDSALVAQMLEVPEDDVVRVLKMLHYSESRIQGQWIK